MPSSGISALAATATTLYVGHRSGLRAFDLATGALKRTVEDFWVSQLALGNGKVYASEGGTTLHELDPELLSTIRTFEVPVGTWQAGRMWVVEAR